LRQYLLYDFDMAESSNSKDLFPERLRFARTTRQLSQEGLAKRADLQASAISHFETGSRKPSFDNLRRLADALDVTTDYLLGRVNDMQAVGDVDRVHRHLGQMSTTDREIAEGFLKMLVDKSNQRPK
jgi:transcriptional regulator with XRE-family HTH domain